VIDPTHNSLLADYYPIDSRSRVSARTVRAQRGRLVRRSAVGRIAGMRVRMAPLPVFVIPTMVFALMALRLRAGCADGGNDRPWAPAMR
jgi:branched-chain amino acid transport system ATP-binding protein